ncbi:DUF4293 domain-containing protein [Parapedobacter sp. ISTM3]|uniref:DUF4293 domain-containing protein n=1 Tax=Parapedobacter luteus TaxID=623280 RepID=A0A1T5D0Q2_9SPHI|nr:MULTISPECIES: DUF4293 domain-containing protein [Parapedobacter]MBK1440559.1 DUF4293 domain-containing protein [Parapedobacter sp. ISTM3]SKB65318.1 protein of unknown function [Parapedobacter luteus]
MIQRIQTIWLFLASATIFALFLFPYLQYADIGGLGKALKVTGVYRGLEGQAIREEFFVLQSIATVLLGVFPLYIIFKFRNRKQQIQLVVLAVVLILLFGVWLYTAASGALTEARQFLSARNIGVGFFLLPISIIFLLMALGGIRRDEKLIKSADRLR